ncbi:RCC1/BLIP-II protein, partial [Glonium stellatum]
HVYTWGDPRYVRCLGRPILDSSPASIPTYIPYLSETRVTKLASGNWMSGALSTEGELFIWGQGSPSGGGEIAALKTAGEDNDNEDEEDEFVKEVQITIDNLQARVYDFGIGSGHLVVAAEVNNLEHVLKRSIFCAGQCEAGQLGLGRKLQFSASLTEVQELRMRRVRSVTCGGNNSFVV